MDGRRHPMLTLEYMISTLYAHLRPENSDGLQIPTVAIYQYNDLFKKSVGP